MFFSIASLRRTNWSLCFCNTAVFLPVFIVLASANASSAFLCSSLFALRACFPLPNKLLARRVPQLSNPVTVSVSIGTLNGSSISLHVGLIHLILLPSFTPLHPQVGQR